MKLKTLSFITGAIALTLTAVPYIAKVQAGTPSPLLVAQSNQGKGPWASLNLTEEQKSQIRTIRQNTRQQLQGFKQELGLAQGQRINYKSLTAEQKQTLKGIKKLEWQQIQAVLTPEQRQQLQQIKHHHHHHHHHQQNQDQNQDQNQQGDQQSN
jgi:Spy/CpxP family protein refolding chaperone